MGTVLQQQLLSNNHCLETLNQRLSFVCQGIPIWTYSEQRRTTLKTQPEEETEIVTSASSEIRNRDHHIFTEEEWESLPANHADIAMLGMSSASHSGFIDYVKKEIMNANSSEQREKHKKLLGQIFGKVLVNRHLLSPKVESGKIVDVDVTSRPDPDSLQRFLHRFLDLGLTASGENRPVQ